MVSTKIKVVVELTVTSHKPLSDGAKDHIVNDMNYSFDFEEMFGANFANISDAEILNVLEE